MVEKSVRYPHSLGESAWVWMEQNCHELELNDLVRRNEIMTLLTKLTEDKNGKYNTKF